MDKINIDDKLEYIEKVKELNNGKDLKYYILTMGCQLNENDSERISGMLEKMGYTKTEKVEESDFIIFNTCCVRENAEDRLFGRLGETKKFKEKNGTIIAIGGCMMQEKEVLKKLKESYGFYDIIFGTHTIHKLPEDIFNILSTNKKIEDIEYIDGEIIEGLPIKRNDNIKANVLLMNGCNNFCTYCIVPYVRGRERSRDPEDIIKEVEELAKNDYKEIMLLGQNVNSYLRVEREKGLIKGEIDSFAKLLDRLCKIEGIERIRFISPHPKDFTDDVIDVIAKNKKICNMIHLPLQSGSTNILKRMNRNYTKESYIKLAEKIKEKIPDVSFTTDIIVGFPGETEEDFKDTLDVVEKIEFEQAFMFIYSKREGTPAEKMEDQIDDEVKHERFNRLKVLVESKIAIINNKYIGNEYEVLVEGTSKTNSDIKTGRLETNRIVNFKAEDELIGKFVKVKILEDHMWYFSGEIIK